MNKHSGYILTWLTVCGLFVTACHEEDKPENFYRIKGDFFHQIEKSEVEHYLSNTDKTGCIFMIRSEASEIPVSDNPKRMPVILVTRLPEDSPAQEDFDEAFSNTSNDINKEPPEDGSQ